MDILFQTILILLLSLVFIQDLRFRAIHIVLPILIVMIGLITYYIRGYNWLNIFFNIIFLVVTFIGLYLYVSFKNKKATNPFKQSMGVGDLLFFVAVVPFFAMQNYILFFISGMLFSIVGFMVLKAFIKTDLVPLAGLLALYMILLKIGVYISDCDVFFNQIS